jgi:hypothetical protein
MLRHVLMDAGLTWDSLQEVEVTPCGWLRPPFYTPLQMQGIPLQPHVAVGVRRPVDFFADLYERFIAGFILQQAYATEPVKWLRAELGLTHKTSTYIFTPIKTSPLLRPTHLHLALVQFAALVSYNVECEIEETADTFCVTALSDGFVFGVREGALASNRRFRSLRARPLSRLRSSTGRLSDIARGRPVSGDFPGIFEACRAWAAANPNLASDAKAIDLALRAVWWRTGGQGVGDLEKAAQLSRSKAALRIAVQQARQYMSYERPYDVLMDIFVPQHLSEGRFKGYFGYPVKNVKPHVQRRWEEAINELDPGEDFSD